MVLQTLISVIIPRDLHSRFVGEELRGFMEIFMDNFGLVLLN